MVDLPLPDSYMKHRLRQFVTSLSYFSGKGLASMSRKANKSLFKETWAGRKPYDINYTPTWTNFKVW